MDRVKLKLCGYVGVYREADFKLDPATSNYLNLPIDFLPPSTGFPDEDPTKAATSSSNTRCLTEQNFNPEPGATETLLPTKDESVKLETTDILEETGKTTQESKEEEEKNPLKRQESEETSEHNPRKESQLTQVSIESKILDKEKQFVTTEVELHREPEINHKDKLGEMDEAGISRESRSPGKESQWKNVKTTLQQSELQKRDKRSDPGVVTLEDEPKIHQKQPDTEDTVFRPPPRKKDKGRKQETSEYSTENDETKNRHKTSETLVSAVQDEEKNRQRVTDTEVPVPQPRNRLRDPNNSTVFPLYDESTDRQKEEEKQKEEDGKRQESGAKRKESETMRKESQMERKGWDAGREELQTESKDPETSRNKQLENRRKEPELEEIKRKESEMKRKESEVKRKEAEMERKELELKRKESEMRRKESEMKTKELEMKRKESEVEREESEVKKKELEAEKKELEMKRKESEVEKKELEMQRKQTELQRKESEMRRNELEIDRKESGTKRMESEIATLSESRIPHKQDEPRSRHTGKGWTMEERGLMDHQKESFQSESWKHPATREGKSRQKFQKYKIPTIPHSESSTSTDVSSVLHFPTREGTAKKSEDTRIDMGKFEAKRKTGRIEPLSHVPAVFSSLAVHAKSDREVEVQENLLFHVSPSSEEEMTKLPSKILSVSSDNSSGEILTPSGAILAKARRQIIRDSRENSYHRTRRKDEAQNDKSEPGIRISKPAMFRIFKREEGDTTVSPLDSEKLLSAGIKSSNYYNSPIFSREEWKNESSVYKGKTGGDRALRVLADQLNIRKDSEVKFPKGSKTETSNQILVTKEEEKVLLAASMIQQKMNRNNKKLTETEQPPDQDTTPSLDVHRTQDKADFLNANTTGQQETRVWFQEKNNPVEHPRGFETETGMTGLPGWKQPSNSHLVSVESYAIRGRSGSPSS